MDAPEHYFSKRQLAMHYGFSTRWVELRTREGMPSRMIGGRRRYLTSECNAWLEFRSRHREAA